MRRAPAPCGGPVPLAEQDRSLWDRALIAGGVALITAALRRGQVGEYQLQAAVAAVHDQAPRDGLDARLGDHPRLHSVRAHLFELDGDTATAIVEFRASAARTTNAREQHYLTTQAARLATGRPEPG